MNSNVLIAHKQRLKQITIWCLLSTIVVIWFVGCDKEYDKDKPIVDDNEIPEKNLIEDDVSTEFLIHVVDVGNGLAVFVEGPDFTLIYDGGSDDEQSDGENNRFLAYLRHVRPDLEQLDHLIVSHPHNDHITLLPDLMRAFAVGNVYDGGAPGYLCAYNAILLETERQQSVYHSSINEPGPHEVSLYGECGEQPETVRLQHGKRILPEYTVILGANASMTFVFVPQTFAADANLNTLVVRLDLGQKRVLLMGDAHGGEFNGYEEPAIGSIEDTLIAKPDKIDSDVLLVGDHGFNAGSRTHFLEAVSPDLSLISAYPLFAPPDPHIVETLWSYGDVYRTDFNDEQCRTEPHKIGPDADGQVGGCSSIQVTIGDNGDIAASYADVWDS